MILNVWLITEKYFPHSELERYITELPSRTNFELSRLLSYIWGCVCVVEYKASSVSNALGLIT